MNKSKKITVCSECLTASCWHGIFMCEESEFAGAIELPIWALEKLKLESSDYWR